MKYIKEIYEIIQGNPWILSRKSIRYVKKTHLIRETHHVYEGHPSNISRTPIK